ncbi:uncharacterized protein SPSK_06624 [Sporothrix schenckii 1099-18]|uniref:Uncharacterized protein n=1 Tax=Sporothrix schenckii 1099-18 TaxID=1397361 RepID=A0A0F2MJT7_SPOSC|nr:uncharacterized protein SPSK_06624 [Sporothrix schenckii 1099-18]KJR89953.1 hypothetical protein SPSK_06624 [Sporothrix schenckii 1099-18]
MDNPLKASASWDDVFAATMTTMYNRPVCLDSCAGGQNDNSDKREATTTALGHTAMAAGHHHSASHAAKRAQAGRWTMTPTVRTCPVVQVELPGRAPVTEATRFKQYGGGHGWFSRDATNIWAGHRQGCDDIVRDGRRAESTVQWRTAVIWCVVIDIEMAAVDRGAIGQCYLYVYAADGGPVTSLTVYCTTFTE